jgi:hypothetical protein
MRISNHCHPGAMQGIEPGISRYNLEIPGSVLRTAPE